jgi:hypothetical protein
MQGGGGMSGMRKLSNAVRVTFVLALVGVVFNVVIQVVYSPRNLWYALLLVSILAVLAYSQRKVLFSGH